jgi:dTDP-4-dehydrorhamnose reductase
MSPIELWGGVECSVNRVGDRWFDQLAKSGHRARLDDFDRFAALGIRALRMPVLWEKLAPEGLDQIDWRWTDASLARLRALGIRPILGLVHHGSGPAYTSLVDPDFPAKLAAFARAVAERYPWVDAYTPINEPLTTARFSALYGHWYPHARDDRAFVRAFLTEMRAIVLAMRAIRIVNPSASLIQTEDAGQTWGTPPIRDQVTFDRRRQWLTFDLLAGRVADGHPLWPYLQRSGATEEDGAFFADAVPPDVVGLNYYLTSDRWLDHRTDRYPPDRQGGNARIAYADVEAVRARPRGIAGHEAILLRAWNRYHLPVAVTEVHLHCSRDEQLRWFAASWRDAKAAYAKGADVRAVTAWALLGSSDWDSLVTIERGHYECGVFDIRGPLPRPTAVARTIAQLASTGDAEHPVLAREGWWRRHRPTRLPLRPVLVIGARGTLGRAFERICALRGLDVSMIGRADADATDRDAAAALLRRTAPWAVVNAAGYVRVDDAERERETCWRENVDLAGSLAAACRAARIPFVTFSSDLVFDGTAGRPYDEADGPSPQNYYGASKAEAERVVLAADPTALVVRTSAFFGPWDEHNFAAAVRRALAAGQPFRAAGDVTVSPTYVPDLVHAVLDLLIDEERGVWHLANQAALSWAAFARAVAAASALDPSLVDECAAADVYGPARRPAFSALTSRRGHLMRPLAAALDEYIGALPPAVVDTGELKPCASQ